MKGLAFLLERKKICMYNEELFYLNGDRAMISLGPLTATQHCPYRCAFCYVQDGFKKYASLNENDIIKFLKENRMHYHIIYISGDTDSFAPPRTDMALHLLDRMSSELDVDLLFTTRTNFHSQHYKILQKIINKQKSKNKLIFSCISITRYSDDLAYIEPKPIPSPDERINTLKKLKEIGAVTVAALRPFLPVVDVNDYLIIISKLNGYVDIVLGEAFYFIRNGNICNRVFTNGILDEYEQDIVKSIRMPFNSNDLEWDVWHSKKYESIVSSYCKQNNIIFSMHSDQAIKEFNENYYRI